jgi:hypothetical protein
MLFYLDGFACITITAGTSTMLFAAIAMSPPCFL